MSATRHEFIRRYATSPIHVARLERVLAAYATDGDADAFAAAFLAWDRAAADADAARVVSEVLSTLVGPDGRVVRLTDQAIRGAIAWMAAAPPGTRDERAAALQGILSEVTGPRGTTEERGRLPRPADGAAAPTHEGVDE